MEKIIFFVYTIIRSDERYEANSNAPVYATIFLISFFELVFFLPPILYLNDVFFIVNLKSFLSLPIIFRYLIIFSSISLISFMNFHLFFRRNKLEIITNKFDHKRDKYLRNKWLLLVFAMILGLVLLVALTVLRSTR
jgi:hypothetical protein